VKGAGALTDIECKEGTPTFLSSSQTLHSLALVEHLIADVVDSNPAFAEFVSKFPKASELFPQVTGDLQMMENEQAESSPWALVLVAFVSFMCGAGLIVLLVKFSSKTTHLPREPLLEEA